MTASLIVRCGERLLALPSAVVVEVLRAPVLAPRPRQAPRHCLGVVARRGRRVPVFDLAGRLGLGPPRDGRALAGGRVVVIADPVGEIGLAVDEVRELSAASVERRGARALGRYTRGEVRAADGTLAPLLASGALLTALARHQLRAALSAAD